MLSEEKRIVHFREKRKKYIPKTKKVKIFCKLQCIELYDRNGRCNMRKMKLQIKTICKQGQYIWITFKEKNLLCRYNLQKKCIDHITYVPAESGEYNMYVEMILYEDYLVMIPYEANEIALLDTVSFQFVKVKLPVLDNKYQYDGHTKFCGGVRRGKLIYLMPDKFPEIICIDMEKMEAQSVMAWYPYYGKWPYREDMGIVYRGIEKMICVGEKDLYFFFYADDVGRFGKFSLDSYGMEVYAIENMDSYFSCIGEDDGKIFVVSRLGQIICWDIYRKKVLDVYFYDKEVDLETSRRFSEKMAYPAGREELWAIHSKMTEGKAKAEGVWKYMSEGVFSESLIYAGQLYLFHRFKPQYVIVDIKKQSIRTCDFQYLKNSIIRTYSWEDQVYFVTDEAGVFYRYMDSGIEVLKLNFNDDIWIDYCKCISEKQNGQFLEWESLAFGLRELEEVMTLHEQRNKEEYAEDIGKKIYMNTAYGRNV